jgi:predicted peptidase
MLISIYVALFLPVTLGLILPPKTERCSISHRLEGTDCESIREIFSTDTSRRHYVAAGFTIGFHLMQQPADALPQERLFVVSDPNTYSAVTYKPEGVNERPKPLLVVLHGAGVNNEDAWALTNPKGEHAGLIPSLIASNKAPPELTENFVVVAPYSQGKRSFYEEPRKKILDFVRWFCSEAGRTSGCPPCDTDHIYLFGFSDGATVAVELATTKMFRAVVIAAYGFSGTLPDLALERLREVPFWVFHSQDDVIFPVKYSDKLVASLSKRGNSSMIRYTRYERDQEGFTGDVKGHSVGITASKSADLYSWMLSIR